MCADPHGSLWRWAAREMLIGPRGVVKVSALWLPLSLVLAATEAPGAAGRCLALFVAVACWTQVCILGNDLADRADDLAAGKRRWIQTLPPWSGVGIVAALAAAGLAAGVAAGAPGLALATYVAGLVVGLLYSLAPVRLKDRGALGPLGYAAAGALAFAVVPWAWFGGGWAVLVIGAAAVALDKWVNLHFHQVVDHDADRSRGRRTLAVALGLGRARATLRLAAMAAALAALAPIAFVAGWVAPRGRLVAVAAAVVAAAASAYAWRARRSGGTASALLRELPPLYLGLSYAAFRALPLLLLASVAVERPGLWVAAALAALTIAGESAHAFRYEYR